MQKKKKRTKKEEFHSTDLYIYTINLPAVCSILNYTLSERKKQIIHFVCNESYFRDGTVVMVKSLILQIVRRYREFCYIWIYILHFMFCFSGVTITKSVFEVKSLWFTPLDCAKTHARVGRYLNP